MITTQSVETTTDFTTNTTFTEAVVKTTPLPELVRVIFIASLAMTEAEFDNNARTAYKTSVATFLELPVQGVLIISVVQISTSQRRLLSDTTLNVSTGVVLTLSTAESFNTVAGPGISAALTTSGFNNSGVSLFAVESISIIDVTPTTAVIAEELDKAALVGIIVGIIVGVVVTVGIVAILCYYCYTQNQGVTAHTGLAMQSCVYHVGDAVPSAPQRHYNAFAREEHSVYANIPPNDRLLHQYPVYINIPQNYRDLHHVPGVVHQAQIPVYCNYGEVPYYHPSVYI
jgi:hypothetical protein